MNCKPGDLAVIVGSKTHPELNGIPVIVVELVTSDAWRCSGHEIERVSAQYGCPPWILDRHLRPIRPSEGADETLSWKEVPAGKPQEVEA